MRIQFAGPSGVGKTTLARWMMKYYNIPFVSGSMSDLIPDTKGELHKDMLSKDKKELYTQDFQLLNLRKNLFSQYDSFISDRSFLDSAAYFIYKQSASIPTCEVDHFLELCKMCLCSGYCDKLIVLNFTPKMIKTFNIEDNNKRITNRYFQAQISSIISMVLDLWSIEFHEFKVLETPYKVGTIYSNPYRVGTINSNYGKCEVLLIDEDDLTRRKWIISDIFGTPCPTRK